MPSRPHCIWRRVSFTAKFCGIETNAFPELCKKTSAVFVHWILRQNFENCRNLASSPSSRPPPPCPIRAPQKPKRRDSDTWARRQCGISDGSTSTAKNFRCILVSLIAEAFVRRPYLRDLLQLLQSPRVRCSIPCLPRNRIDENHLFPCNYTDETRPTKNVCIGKIQN